MDVDGSRVRRNRRHIRKDGSSIVEEDIVEQRQLEGEEPKRYEGEQIETDEGNAIEENSMAGCDTTVQNDGG